MNKTQTSHTASSNRINISMEHSRFLPEIEDCFKETGIPISASHMRLSAQELPMQILIFVGSSIAGGVIYDLLKAGIKKVFLKFKNTAIVVRDQEGILFGIHEDEKVNAVVISERRAEFSHIKTLDNLIAHLNSLNQSGWFEKRLGELCTKIGSGATPRGGQEAYKKEGISLIRSQNVNDFSFSYKGLAFIDEQQARKLNNVTVQEDDVLLNITGDSVARVCKPPKDVLPARVNQHVAIIRPDKKTLDSNFLQYYLLNPTFKKHMLLIASNGATRNAITKGNIEDFKLFLPAKLKEQKAISAVLSSFDDKIELLRQQNQTLEEMAQTLFKEWFVEYRFPGAGKMVDSELEIIPKGWEVKSIQEISDVAIGRTPPRKESEWFSIDKSDWKWVSIRDMGNSGIYISETAECLTKRAVVKFNVPIAKKGTILVSFKLTLGRINIANEDLVTNEAIAHINLKSTNNLNAEFMYLFFKNFNFNSLGSTSSIATAVNSQSIKRIELVIPTNDVLLKFKILINPLFSKIDNNSQQIQTLSQLRDRLLPKLMSGEIKVKM